MKKYAIIAMVMIGGVALASSLNVPWFVDNAAVNVGLLPPSGTLALVALHNNTNDTVTCWIDYYAADGTPLDYDNQAGGLETEIDPTVAEGGTREYIWSATYNTFVITANATVQFRPVAHDPGGTTSDPAAADGGQESETGMVVPNRPRYLGWNAAFTKKKNGALVVTWTGDPSDIQGRYCEWGQNMQAAYLLPAGA